MKVLLDSATLIAAMLPDHLHHACAYPWLAQGKAGAFEFGEPFQLGASQTLHQEPEGTSPHDDVRG